LLTSTLASFTSALNLAKHPSVTFPAIWDSQPFDTGLLLFTFTEYGERMSTDHSCVLMHVHFIMAPNTAGHYILLLQFLLFFFLFFPRLFSVAIDWMSTMLPHMV